MSIYKATQNKTLSEDEFTRMEIKLKEMINQINLPTKGLPSAREITKELANLAHFAPTPHL